MTNTLATSVEITAIHSKALLVEDDEVMQIAHQYFLETLGYQVDLAANGYEALELAARSDYHCALLDLGLPDIGGESVLSALRYRERKTGKRRLPIIVNSAGADEAVFQRCREMGADATLPKPVVLEELSRVLSSLSSHHAEDPLA